MQKQLKIPRVVITAPQGQSGKTTVSIGLIGALVHAGYRVQPFKKGPDFIDPSWLSRVSGRSCRNLDCFLMDDDAIRTSVFQTSFDSDIAVIEGAMGMFDGVDLMGSGSTAQVAKILKAPALLVVDCHRMTRSVAALVKGFKDFDPEVKLAGVILNNVARLRHQEMLSGAIERYCDLPVLGVIPKNVLHSIPNRHLGLIPAEEDLALQKAIAAIAQTAQDALDLGKIFDLACEAPVLSILDGETRIHPGGHGEVPVTIGVIRDRAFSFYYPENLTSLEQAGARLVDINALENRCLPEIDALFIGGGFPEVFLDRLAENKTLRHLIAQKIEAGLPVYAECGGLMYLGRSIIKEEQRFPMVGVLPFDVVIKNKPQGHGYTVMDVAGANPFFALNSSVKGHEFHHSCLVDLDTGSIDFAFKVRRGHGIDGERDGIIYKNVLASYNHIHALGTKNWAERFVAAAALYRDRWTENKKVSNI
ncbi:cobyrinate a,c-diamide synthase [Candidatus Formimonas warabiya]|uniref:Cobyrinate a,c-diamide synthase n=1 Tax=Formimonas warabiya TaxID=1761012 RepID=A0A3G1KY07_FORW1|nr:cobyrinate a,c-diamide synthase [Candidatus Formimonas warabiya]ATW27368.1 cobyrinic acid a,c-diamide synthase [Candidatus Formimonas warabiya]